MKKRIALILILTLFTSIAQGEYVARVSPHWNGFRDMIAKWFPSDVEIVFFVLSDGNEYSRTTGKKSEVTINLTALLQEMKDDGYSVDMIILCIHNHRDCYGFSEEDEGVFETLKKKGFIGSFCVYEKECHQVIELEEVK